VRIRQATQADWAAIWPLWHRVVSAGETYMWAPDTDQGSAEAAWMLPPPAAVFVAEDDGGIVGTAQLKPNQPGRGDHIANAAFMVDPDRPGEGIGRTLAHHVLSAARSRRYRAMQFNAVVATNVVAIGLWESLGFTIVGTVPGAFRHPTDGFVDIHVMYRLLVP
jgi:GNAT superfamily N-acetyltransferase